MRSDAKYYAPDEQKGGYRYIGTYYRFRAAGGALKTKKRIFLLCAFLAFAAFLLAGFADGGQTRAFYVGIPYALSLLPAGLGTQAALSTLRMDERMTFPQFRRGPKRLVLCARACAILSLASLAGCAYLAVRGGEGNFAFPLSLVVMLTASAFSWVLYQRDPPCAAPVQ